MRLIDADKLMESLNPKESVWVGLVLSELITNTTTVEAIPIEWLNKRAEEIAFAYWTNARNKMTLPLNELPLLIDQIIGEWEKENEPNKKNTSQID